MVRMNVLEALQDKYVVRLVTSDDPKLGELNEFCGTDVEPRKLDCHRISETLPGKGVATVSRGLKAAMRQSWWPLGDVRSVTRAMVNRVARRFESDSDVMVSTRNEMYFGIPSVSYVHNPNFYYDRLPGQSISKIYPAVNAACLHIVGASGANDFADGRLLANSSHTAGRLQTIYDTEPSVVYPPVDVSAFEGGPDWEDRDAGFITIGRVEPGKQIGRVVDIMTGLRERGHDVHLHVIGQVGDSTYAERIRRDVRDKDYVYLEGMLVGDELESLVQNHRYALFASEGQTFGISIVESIAAGCLTFIPNSGGQVDILGGDSQFLYDTVEEGIEKISRALSRNDGGKALCEDLPDPKETFGRERFHRQIREHVAAAAGD